MTSVLGNRDGVRDAATAAAAAACSALTLGAALDSPLAEADALPQQPGARAVSVNVRGAAAGTLVLVLGPGLAAAVTAGPLGAQDLVAALGPALADAGAALEKYCGAPLQVEAAHEVEAAISLAGVGDDGRLHAAVPILVGGEHVATLALVVDPELADSRQAIPKPRSTSAAPESHDFAPLAGTGSGAGSRRPLDLLHDVEMGVTAELGRTRMTVRDLLSLTPGAVVELDRAAGSPVDVLVNGTLIARGEVVVIDEEFGIRISEIVGMRSDETSRR